MNETGNSSKGTNVQVAVRCRPVNAEERKSGQPSIVTCDSENKTIKIAYGPTGKKQIKNFAFDRVFGMYSRQEEVFDTMVRPIVDEVLEGFNCTIFAYGQTGTGKTHTMEGNIHSEEDAGIVPRSVKAILENLEASGSEFTIRVSFLELYNEELQDLLNISGDKKLKLCEDVKKGVICQNLEEITVLSVKDIFDILQRGIQQRQTAATLCNKNSSRSHSIFTMKIMIKECNVEGEEVIRHGQLNLVDLAGSECIGRSGAKNDRAREAGSINQSLLTLGRVITALVDHHGHIPYRDSKLTRLLQESLGGKAKTCIIATLSPSQSAGEESMSTLDYAYRARAIKNQPTVNQRLTKKTIMKEYLAEVETLKLQLMQTREKNGVYLDPAEFYAMEARLAAQDSQLEECESALAQRNEEIKLVRKERDEYFAGYESTKQELATCAAELDEVRVTLDDAKETVSSAYLELSASEAVVGEQKATESALFAQGQCLQKDLRHAQTDVSKLLEKVQRAARSEEQKLHESAQFVGQLTVSAKELVAQVQSLSSASNQHAGTLNAGVSQMLQHGRDTCSTLKAAIANALTTMIGDAEQARDEMIGSCSGLKTHLQSTNSHLETTLRALQGQLSEWLGEVDSSMQQAQQQLALQEKQLAVASTTVANHCARLNEMSAAYLAEQGRLKDAALQEAEELKGALEQQLREYSQQSQQASGQATSALKSQAAAMENAMRTMLQELVTTGVSAFEASTARARTMNTATTERLHEGVAALSSAQAAIHQSSMVHNQEVSALVQSSSSTFAADMQVAATQRQSADQMLASVSGAVGTKRKFLDSTVTELCSHVDAAIEQGVQVVDSTSATATKVLSDVSAASQAMNASATASMEAFTQFMDQEGEALSEGLQAHFGMVASHAGAQSAGLAALYREAGAHGEAMQAAKLQATGTTPRKVQVAAFEGPFKRTRSHGAIRDQTRDAVLRAHVAPEDADEVRVVAYEVAKGGIMQCAEAARVADSTDEDAEMVGEEEDVATTPASESTTVAAVMEAPVVEEEPAVLAAVSSRSSSGSTVSASSGSSKSQSSRSTAASVDDLDADGAFLENANPNITNTRASRGAMGKSRSKIATLGSRTRSSASDTL